MRQHSVALSVSVILHAVIILVFFRMPLDRYLGPKLMVLDFSLEKRQPIQGDAERPTKTENMRPQNAIRQERGRAVKDHQEKSTVANRAVLRQQESVQQTPRANETNPGTVSEPDGQVGIAGEAAPGLAQSATAMKKRTDGGTAVHDTGRVHSTNVIDYGQGGPGPDEFPFIKETINKKFKGQYPERARRMGWEGKVIVSFIISEGGTIHSIRITKGAAHDDFNDHAREILSKTTFGERLPRSLKIENFLVTYKLS